ncbi:DNA cytosine methyltransferase [Dickeya dadantii subsp. dieffenbachiae]|uniref:DNA cytosine methyltransferase n=1 Tax=Dickeya dadantii TaxID=204038 RepID=UPI00039D3D00|nr:DNA cytosine methyltransferase [Dickeya dadantii]
MQPLAYYNEIDKFAAQWLRNLIDAGHIAPGIVDTRSIEDVTPNDLKGFSQYHFFAGIGVWSYALRRAGWPDSRPAWTGSCPCQPFSAAGKKGGVADERHLWPSFFHLIQQCRPDVVFGEQVASSDGRAWFDTVQTDMENVGYACAALDLCAAGVGAPNIRQRLFWVADDQRSGLRSSSSECVNSVQFDQKATADAGTCCGVDGMDNAVRIGRETGRDRYHTGYDWQQLGTTGESCRVAHANGNKQRQGGETGECNECTPLGRQQDPTAASGLCGDMRPLEVNGFWRDADWICCRDGKWRPVESGSFPLANGVTGRVGRLRAYGNAINAEVATAFVSAYMGRADNA